MPTEAELLDASHRDEKKARLSSWWHGTEPAHPTSGLADETSIITPDADGYVPLKQRLMAWWNGNEAITPQGTQDASLHIENYSDTPTDNPEWPDERLELSKSLWGAGLIRPNTEVFAKHLMARLRLDSRRTILDIAPGFCATSLLIAEQKNVWIEAIQSDANLMDRVRQHLDFEKFGRQIGLRHENFATLNMPALRYHIIFGREHLYAFPNKDHIVAQLCRSLRDHGKLVFFDYVIKDGSNNSTAIEAWRELEPDRVHPWTVGEYRQALEEGGAWLLGRDDFTDQMIQEIKTAWHRMLQNLQSGDVKPEIVDSIMSEGRLWQSRLQAMQSGDLKLLRLDARKTVKGVSIADDVVV